MKEFFTLIIVILLTSSVSSQLVNNGATIVVKPGATLYVETSIENNVGSTITNQGTIEVQGDFTNAATLTSEADSKIVFSGNADADITSGGAILEDVEMKKTAADIILIDEMAINGDLVFLEDNNHIVLGANDLVLGADATVNVNASTTRYIEATGGMVEKQVSADATFVFPIGDATNYTPLTSNYQGTAYAAATIRTKVNAEVHPNKPADASDFISRYWDVEATGITDYENTLTGTYAAADVTGTDTKVKGATYDANDWAYADAANAGMTVSGTTTTNSVDFTGTNFFGRLDLKVFLQGAYNGTDMTTTLNTNNLIPLTSPYTADAVTVGSIPADVTDWILIELRDVSTPSTILSSHSAFLKKDGSVLHTDGTDMPKFKDATVSSAIAAVHHRNHLAIRTDGGLSLDNPMEHDFTSGLSQAYDDPGNSVNESMADESGTYVMWKGNVNGNTSLNVVDLIQSKSGTNPSDTNVYLNADVNMNGSTNVVDLIQTKAATNPSKTAHL